MADLNYTNPASFMPPNEFKASGPLGGVQWMQQAQDYRQQMEHQMFLQELARREAAMKTNEFEQGAPLRQMQQQGKMEQLQGAMPFLSQQAAVGAQHDISGKQFEMGTAHSNEAKGDYFRKILQGASDDDQKKFNAELGHAGRIANEALNIAKQQGMVAAQAHVEQQMARARQAGLNIPEQMRNPQSWAGIYNASIDSYKHIQEMEQQNARSASAREVATIGAEGRIEAAANRAEQERNRNPAQQFARISDIPEAQRTPEQKQFHKSYVGSQWAKDAPNLIMAEMMAGGDKTKRKSVDQIRKEYFANHGYKEEGGGGAGKYKSADEVRKDYRDGKISRETARKELGAFGYQ